MRAPAAMIVVSLMLASGEASAVTLRCAHFSSSALTGMAGTFRVGGSLMQPAFAFGIGGHYQWESWQLGVEAEVNPYFSIDAADVDAGGFAANLVGGVRTRLTDGISFRFQAGIGPSVLLFDLYGFDAGTVGFDAVARALGLDLRVGRRMVVGVDLLDASITCYRPDIFPFVYYQVRATLSLTLYSGGDSA